MGDSLQFIGLRLIPQPARQQMTFGVTGVTFETNCHPHSLLTH
jgi:hypothetical protein